MVNSMVGIEKVDDEFGTSCGARKYRSAHKIMVERI